MKTVAAFVAATVFLCIRKEKIVFCYGIIYYKRINIIRWKEGF
ncbi:hypothetical protein HMPREF3201_00157 [Megasphaera sp. MJR8396C]|nr:hypothetical protein HMPREF3201_00157 [Megasphaera sp. MJR8396C]